MTGTPALLVDCTISNGTLPPELVHATCKQEIDMCISSSWLQLLVRRRMHSPSPSTQAQMLSRPGPVCTHRSARHSARKNSFLPAKRIDHSATRERSDNGGNTCGAHCVAHQLVITMIIAGSTQSPHEFTLRGHMPCPAPTACTCFVAGQTCW